MNIKDLASKVRQLQQDETFLYIIESIKKEQSNTFLNPSSTPEEREAAHHVVVGLSKIEGRINAILMDEAIFDKQQR